MLETHNMLRSDTTTLFERLREANILLQEVLSGAHENMSSIENTLVTRVSEFVATMNEVSERSGVASEPGRPAHQLVPHRHQQGADRTSASSPRSSTPTAARSPKRSRCSTRATAAPTTTLGERRAAIETLVTTLDARTDDIEQRLKRFSSLLDESLDGATGRAREIARIVADSSAEGARVLEQERQRASELLHGIYTEHSGETHEMFAQTTQRFTETLQGMQQMAAEMQRELEATRTELRRGILELPQETAESAAQMRRVIVDQIEALAELNRIVARHGRGLDAAEPMRRAPEAGLRRRRNGRAEAGPRMGPPPARRCRRGPTSPAPRRAAVAPRRLAVAQPGQAQSAGNGNASSGWLSDLLHRASKPRTSAARRRASGRATRWSRSTRSPSTSRG